MNNTCGNVIADILSRLPSKAVLRFKIVSKAWYALICDHVFIKLHSQRVTLNTKILLSITNKSDFLFPELKLCYDSLEISRPINFPKKESPVQPYKIIGSSLGLVCIATDYCGSFYIWNPTTRESRKIPNMGSEKIKHYEYIHGLGYDSLSNDFKVVISLYPVEYTEEPIIFNVFSLQKNLWRQILSPFQYFYNPVKYPSDWQFKLESYGETKSQFEDYAVSTIAMVLNGVFHWIVRVPNEDDPQIIAFDSIKETFHKLQIPKERFHKLTSWRRFKAHTLLSLLEQNRCLCLSCYNDESSYIKEIWMMKEYGNHRSWIHLHNIAMDIFPDPEIIYKPLCITRKLELLLHTVDYIMICRRKTKMEINTRSSREKKYVDVWNLFGKGSDTHSTRLLGKSIFGATLVDETLISPHGITHKSMLISKFNFFSRVLVIFWVVINSFMNVCRVFKLYLFKDFM